ncbi:hypothetical protein BKK80_01780 [Cupriavidus malaysiensis]|uniref:Uncharacterized protein n=1 Tax=Cupriavidus malaysiensis TaxID=367825 RepID=A0ABN4TC07_9BURK|nr:hypothetical protein BKK80_01780 [Cupriavidus malaysiensis]
MVEPPERSLPRCALRIVKRLHSSLTSLFQVDRHRIICFFVETSAALIIQQCYRDKLEHNHIALRSILVGATSN